ncbi:MAG: NnrS family protein [Gammaproteobacteria bacterium]|nr:NnrS family protein [Gammaproteobacteria bacterium]MCW8841262.1 NnrS family protein [Gammaproteobacteria bacterium]MCW8928126.1 NnrS family protein [Gammaproteobacteria bacterium]MCW8973185.1 NnrS family protein [Gammaproteobacteria bacterium]MCW8993758.1 NnrS family protein [Gammaproteobacteria bacterium]
MALLDIQTPESKPLNNGMTFLALGFRPFFLFAGFAAVILLSLWLLIYNGLMPAPAYYGALPWHGHEMLFGYTAAVVAGFLLTAAKNWTGIQTLRYGPLGGLALLWLLGRLVPFLSGSISPWLIALVDFSFMPMAALALAFPLFKSKQAHNTPFVYILLALAVANGLFHLQLLGLTETTLQAGIRLALGMLVVLLAVMGGRVIPFFIERGLPGVQNRKWQWVEKLSVISVLLFLLADLFFPGNGVTIAITLVAAAIHAVRVAGWYHHRIWSVSLLWVLFIGYAWVAVGLLMHALAAAGVISSLLAIHAFTVGAIGVLTLGMMARVSIGHTGRPMKAHPLIGWAFALVAAAAVVRVWLPLLWPQSYVIWVTLSGLLWIAAFVPFVVLYFPMLIKPRVDGREG